MTESQSDRPDHPAPGRSEQHGPGMDDTQVEATGEFADALDPVTPDDAEDDAGN